MRTFFAVVVAVLPALLFPVDRAGAEITYPWCAQYSTKGGARNCGFNTWEQCWCAQYSTKGGARNCGFNTWEQCRATVSGVGGYCERNPMYRPVIEPRRARRIYG